MVGMHHGLPHTQWTRASSSALLPHYCQSAEDYIPTTVDTRPWSPMLEARLPRNSGRHGVEKREKRLGDICIHLLFSSGPETYSRVLAIAPWSSRVPLCWLLQGIDSLFAPWRMANETASAPSWGFLGGLVPGNRLRGSHKRWLQETPTLPSPAPLSVWCPWLLALPTPFAVAPGPVLPPR